MKFEIEESLIEKHFTEQQIEAFMRELDFTRAQAVLYLFMFNNICHFKLSDLQKDCGRGMYRKFAKGLTEFLKEVSND